uniref:Uncharacterized protein n=1 Tax=Lactifluus piperatus TaxID=71966 RepID=A0A2Z4MA40_9AGAM|nr:hypothetical protein [Lactifluus piperatus]AWX53025.1 hypothetical protein [Lactifluus piperatus]
MDLYGIDYISNTIDWIKNNSLTQLFKTKVENIEQVKEISTSLKSNNRSTTRNEESNKIADWYNRLFNREPEVITEDETPIYKNKYVIAAAILILLSLSYWNFKDSIDPVISDTVEKLQRFRSGTNRDSTTICEDVVRPIEGSNKSWWKGLTDKVKSLWNRDTKPTPDNGSSSSTSHISVEDRSKYFKGDGPPIAGPSADLKGKGIDLTDPSERWKETKRLLDQLSGNTKTHFDKEASSVLNQMSAFIANHDNNTFPKDAALVQGLYVAINASLHKLKWTSGVLWDNLFKDENVRELHDRFTSLPQEIGIPTGEDLYKVEEENARLYKEQLKAERNSYNEVANATIHEQDVWSDRASAHSPHSHFSEIECFDETTEQVEIPELKVRTPKASYAETLDKVTKKDTDQENTSYFREFMQYENETQKFLEQKIEDSINKVEPLNVDNLLNAFKSRRDDSNIVESVTPRPKSPSSGSIHDYFNEPIASSSKITENQNVASKVVEKVSEKVEQTKTKFTNLFDAIKSRRNDSNIVDGSNIQKDSSQVQSNFVQPKEDNVESKVSETIEQNKNTFTNLVDAIKSRISVSQKDSSQVKEVPQVTENVLDSLIEDANILDDQEILEKVKTTFSSEPIASSSKITEDPVASKITEEPVASTSKIIEEDKPSGFSTLFKEIKSHRKEYGTPVMQTRDELLREVETKVNTPQVNTPSIVVDEALPEILESVKGLKKEVSKEELFNVGLSPRLDTHSLHKYPSVSNLFDDTQNLFDDQDEISDNQSVGSLTNWKDVEVKVNNGAGYFYIDFGDKLKDVQEMHITLNNGKVHILKIDSRFVNNQDNIFKFIEKDSNLEVFNIDILDKYNKNARIYSNDNVTILPNFELTPKESIKSFNDYKVKGKI